MKPILANLLALFLIVSTSCQDTVSPTDNLNQAQKWIKGKWNLTAVSGMMINPTVPNVQLIVNNDQIILIQAGKQTDQVNFEIVETDYNLQLKTNAQLREDNWYVRDPALRISKNRMLLDAGMATDGPGFTFERVE